MPDNAFEMPLNFAGHNARILVTHPFNGPWLVRTEVDGRVLGWEQFAHRFQVERFRARMQDWIAQVEAAERRGVRAA
jgi:hypothetical protein